MKILDHDRLNWLQVIFHFFELFKDHRDALMNYCPEHLKFCQVQIGHNRKKNPLMSDLTVTKQAGTTGIDYRGTASRSPEACRICSVGNNWTYNQEIKCSFTGGSMFK